MDTVKWSRLSSKTPDSHRKRRTSDGPAETCRLSRSLSSHSSDDEATSGSGRSASWKSTSSVQSHQSLHNGISSSGSLSHRAKRNDEDFLESSTHANAQANANSITSTTNSVRKSRAKDGTRDHEFRERESRDGSFDLGASFKNTDEFSEGSVPDNYRFGQGYGQISDKGENRSSRSDHDDLIFHEPDTELISDCSHFKRRLSVVSDDVDGISSQLLIREEAVAATGGEQGGCSPKSATSLTSLDADSTLRDGPAIKPPEMKYTIGGGIDLEAQRSSNLSALSPIVSAHNARKQRPRWAVACAMILSLGLVGVIVKVFAQTEGEGPPWGDAPGDFYSHHPHIVTGFMVISACIGLAMGANYILKRRRLAEERVLLAHGDEVLSNVVAKARAEWQAGRFANQRPPGSPHFEPTSSQRRWATELLNSHETLSAKSSP